MLLSLNKNEEPRYTVDMYYVMIEKKSDLWTSMQLKYLFEVYISPHPDNAMMFPISACYELKDIRYSGKIRNIDSSMIFSE